MRSRDGYTSVVREDLPGYREPFTERCEGCDGTGHLGHRVPSQIGVCEACLGTGRVLFTFTGEDEFMTSIVLPSVAAPLVWGRDYNY